ncbi:MAG: HAD family phosphatase [Ruminococcaceae bacterium]|nr:HAD family phosphatase [Oscillospiraceae bacterium]
MNTKYLFFDLDGTVSFDGDTVAPRELECLKKLQAMGHKVIINTGRGLSHISKKILNAIEWDGIIAGTGYVRFDGDTVCNESLPTETVRKLYNFCKERNAVGIFEGVYTIYTSVPYPVTEVLLTDENIDDTHDVTCVTVLTHIDEEEAKKLFPEVTTVIMPRYFEGNPKGFSKATGMKLIGEKYGIDPCDMIAFGDSENDEKMLRYAGTSVAIGNVPERFNEFVTHHAESTADALIEMFEL